MRRSLLAALLLVTVWTTLQLTSTTHLREPVTSANTLQAPGRYPIDGCAVALTGTTVQELYLTSGYAPSTPGYMRSLDCWTLTQSPTLSPITDITPGAGYWCHFHPRAAADITVLVFDIDPSGSGAAQICP